MRRRSRLEFQRILAERGIPHSYDTDDLADDSATLPQLEGGYLPHFRKMVRAKA